MNSDKITLTLTVNEATWLADALTLAATTYDNNKDWIKGAWTMRMAQGLAAKADALAAKNAGSAS